MQLADLLTRYSETIDVFVVLESGKDREYLVKDVLRERANIVYFQPHASHKHSNRKQEVHGQFSTKRPVLIYDESWCQGNSFREISKWLKETGYNPNDIFVFYLLGEQNDKVSDSTSYFASASEFLHRLAKR